MINMPTKKEVQKKKREDFRKQKPNFREYGRFELEKDLDALSKDEKRPSRIYEEEQIEQYKGLIRKAEYHLKNEATDQAAEDYEEAAKIVAHLGDYRLAARVATVSEKLWRKSTSPHPKFHMGYRERAQAMNEYAHAMRHEAARQKVRSKKSLLERLFSVVVAITIVSFLGVLYFLSPNITGNVVGINNVYSNWIGGVLFIVGLVGVFIYFKFKSN